MPTYRTICSQPLFERLAPWRRGFGRRTPRRELAVEDEGDRAMEADILVFGTGRCGSRLPQRLRARGVDALGFFDPEAVHDWHGKGVPVRFGDAADQATQHVCEALRQNRKRAAQP